jgi:colanic acid/amylovoran biosynthesis glycosyltransferase
MPGSMRVAFTHYLAIDDIGGVTTWITSLLRQLHSDGIEVGIHLIDATQGLDPVGDRTILRELIDAGIHVSSSPEQRSLKGEVRKTIEFLNTWKPTVFLPQCIPPHFVAGAIAGKQGIPWALTIHSDDQNYWSVAESVPPPQYGGRTVCVSKHIARSVVNAEIDLDPIVIPCGVRVPQNQTHFSIAPFRVAYSGRLVEKQKRASLVINALIKACERNPYIAATVIGDGNSRRFLEQEVDSAGMGHAINFSGLQTPGNVQNILANCQAIVLMSDFEGLPVALLEAMAMGVVPVVRDISSGIPELIQHNQTGILVGDDPNEAASAILRLANDSTLWQRCSEGARELVIRKYSSEQSYNQWQEFLAELSRDTSRSYPIKATSGIILRRLHPDLYNPYRRNPRLREIVKQHYFTRVAQLKHMAREGLSRFN